MLILAAAVPRTADADADPDPEADPEAAAAAPGSSDVVPGAGVFR